MTRRLADRHPRRLLRMRPPAQRPEHGLDLALVRPEAGRDPANHPDGRALRALAEENALLARELGRVQARFTQWRDDCIAQADGLQAQLMRARGALLAKDTELAVLRDALEAARGGAASASPIAGTRVLCVGGRARQVPVYREMVERAGGRFAHVDGATPDGLQALRHALVDADLVVLQPAYACQGACRLVEAHCARSGARCVQLDKACALGFMQGLEQALSGRSSRAPAA